jgi:transposase
LTPSNLRFRAGAGEQTSVYLIITTKGFTAFKNWRQFACYSGVVPFEYSSGSSIKERTKVNHMADKKIKSLLQMYAMTALKYDPQIKEYYNKKKDEGKNSMLVLNNIRCKLVSGVFAVINRETPYINTYKFAS